MIGFLLIMGGVFRISRGIIGITSGLNTFFSCVVIGAFILAVGVLLIALGMVKLHEVEFE